ASTALPPRASTASPTSVATGSVVVTIPDAASARRVSARGSVHPDPNRSTESAGPAGAGPDCAPQAPAASVRIRRSTRQAAFDLTIGHLFACSEVRYLVSSRT